jgi:hypothetical protein
MLEEHTSCRATCAPRYSCSATPGLPSLVWMIPCLGRALDIVFPLPSATLLQSLYLEETLKICAVVLYTVFENYTESPVTCHCVAVTHRFKIEFS